MTSPDPEAPQPATPGGLLREVAARIDRQDLFRDVRSLLVACSGAGDSTVLLHLPVRLQPVHGVELAVVHLDHGWRAESAADAAFVRRLAAEREVDAVVERRRVDADGDSREAAARRARLELFARTVRDRGADAVALAHTADDQVETVLLSLARGSGLRGLGGMHPRRRVEGVLLLRPLLRLRREELREYARSRGLEWRLDATNLDVSLTRNRVRRRLVPELVVDDPAATENVTRAAELLVRCRLDALRRPEPYPGGVGLDADRLREEPRALQRRLLLAALEEVRGHRRGLGREHVDAVIEEILGGREAARDLPGARVRAEKGRLRLLPLAGRRLAPPAPPDDPPGGVS